MRIDWYSFYFPQMGLWNSNSSYAPSFSLISHVPSIPWSMRTECLDSRRFFVLFILVSSLLPSSLPSLTFNTHLFVFITLSRILSFPLLILIRTQRVVVVPLPCIALPLSGPVLRAMERPLRLRPWPRDTLAIPLGRLASMENWMNGFERRFSTVKVWIFRMSIADFRLLLVSYAFENQNPCTSPEGTYFLLHCVHASSSNSEMRRIYF